LSGIYVHIPYCKQACNYCDFHFSTKLITIPEMIQAMTWEIDQRKNFLPTSTLETVYFGGGTPSLLNPSSIELLLNSVQTNFKLDLKEFTLEINPDDLTQEKLSDWKSLGVNRLSIGIQSFQDDILKFYNRAHNSSQAIKALDLARNSGIKKLSLDLIYGFPYKNHDLWLDDLKKSIAFDPGHISSYCLTVEPKTVLGNQLKHGKFIEASEEFAAEQFEMLQEETSKAGYVQYEISNFGKENDFAIHNSNYWKGTPYLGIGPGAHSFDGKNRGSNYSNNNLYLKSYRNNQLSFQIEPLSEKDVINEYILTSLRTIWGTSVNRIAEMGMENFISENYKKIQNLEKEGLLSYIDHQIILTKKGKLLADGIAASLFI
jgi:oxygen-independent coproporphyrinogen III oxidase